MHVRPNNKFNNGGIQTSTLKICFWNFGQNSLSTLPILLLIWGDSEDTWQIARITARILPFYSSCVHVCVYVWYACMHVVIVCIKIVYVYVYVYSMCSAMHA